MNDTTLPLAILVSHLRQAKKAEDDAKTARLKIEEQIVRRFPVPDGGEGMHKDEEFNITFKVSRKVDTAAIQKEWDTITAAMHKAVRWKAELDTKNYRALAEFDPQGFQDFAKYVTTTPLKPSIEIKD